ncbi:hypothetical protein Tco_0172109, partial [Tanacetum coccineum]
DMAELVQLQICVEFRDTWAWVPTRPARQEGNAGGVVEEAPVALGGGEEDEEMPQAVSSPPRTQGERIDRLEEDVHGMREAGVTYTRYSESPVEYQRRNVRHRTDGASTSTAPHQPDP